MGCGCGQVALREEVGNSLFKSGYMPPAGPNGVYELASHRGCTRPYNGRSRTKSVYVIGLNTEHERIFHRKDNRAAIRYAKETDEILHHIGADRLCHEAMEAFFGD